MTVLRRLGRLRPVRDIGEPASVGTLEPGSAAPVAHEIEFAGYAEDCRVFGFYRLAASRLTDALNDADAYDLNDVLLVRLDSGLGAQASCLTIHREELLLVRATGPRGDPGRRSRRRPSPVTLQTGPYVVHGYVHGLPGGDPIAEVRRRRAMVPLTESWIEYRTGGGEHRARSGTLIVNRDLIDWVRLSKDEEVGLPDLPVEVNPSPLLKDLTGYIHTEPAERDGSAGT
jgi:hypothetical protein